MAVSAAAANLYLTFATRTSPALLRIDRPFCTDHNRYEHTHMMAIRWNELCAVWEVQDTDTCWVPIV